MIYGNNILEDYNFEFKPDKNKDFSISDAEKFISSKTTPEGIVKASLAVFNAVESAFLASSGPVGPGLKICNFVFKKYLSKFVYNVALNKDCPDTLDKIIEGARHFRAIISKKLNNTDDDKERYKLFEAIAMCDKVISDCKDTQEKINKTPIIKYII